ncbi:MAG: AAC(3) family N-acetyltransferase [Bacteroidia bacterium]
MRNLLKIILPKFFINFLKEIKRKSKYKQLDNLREKGEIVSKDSIKKALNSAGIKEGDVLMVHSSLSSLGYVDGGAETVISVLMALIGDKGTLMMPSFPGIGFNYDYLKSNPIFDINQTPSKMGAITEVFRKMNGVKRSFHPTDAVCAFGPQADYLTNDHFNQLTPYNEHSPFRKLELLNGKILLLGTKLEHVTNFHTPEDAIPDFKYPVYANEVLEVKMIDEKGVQHLMKTKVHNKTMSKLRKCNQMEQHFSSAGFYHSFKVGKANCAIIEAKAMHEWLIENYKKGITMYTPNGEELSLS